jgi:Fe(3+) dicitrate transport protein
MFTHPRSAERSRAHLNSLVSHRWLVAVATLVVILFIRRPIAAQTAETAGVVVTGEPVATPTPYDNFREMRQHIMPEVSGTQITVTKKATIIKLEQQPPIENNALQDEFIKAPGLLVTEQHTPGQFNFSYRGLGNPQESEFITVLMDGVPLASDWIGFPTLYYLPFPQSVSEIQFIRGGSSLLFGPEPAPAINFITKRPPLGSRGDFYTEQVGGPYGLYTTYNVIEEAAGPLEIRLDGGYARADGQRDHSAYDIWQTDLYVAYRPDEHQVLDLEFHASRFDGDDPGRLSILQFNENPNQSTTPFNKDWVDRYSAVLRYERDFGDGWLFQGKGWYTHQEIDNLGLPFLVDQNFNNGGIDLRMRKNWGDATIFKGSTLTFGGLAYHGDGPYNQRFATPDTHRDDDTGPIRVDQDRESDYQAVFFENIFRLGKFHIVPSFRLDHEHVEVDENISPFAGAPGQRPLATPSADHWVPLWGIGLGNDFGNHNETYFSASSGWRPTRWFDISSPFQNIAPGHPSDPFHSLDFELGVHGTPLRGFWYDVGAFWMLFDNRTETRQFSTTEFVIANTGSTRNRGLEAELSYDFLAPFQHPPVPQPALVDEKNVVDKNPVPVPGTTEKFRPLQLVVFSNVQFLDATFTESDIPDQVGKTPAFAPDFLWKGGISFRREQCFNIMLSAVYVSEQFWSDANVAAAPFPGAPSTPAKLPAYAVVDLSGEYYITKNVRIFGGITNLTDEKYYSRVFFNGSIEPAPSLSGYAGVSLTF